MSTTVALISAVALAGAAGAGIVLISRPCLEGMPAKLAEAVGLASWPDKPGWMDHAPLTGADRQRIAEITGTALADQEGHSGVIRSIQSGIRSGIGRRDFELLRQDRRRARAAYPGVDPSALFRSGWFQVDRTAEIPADWNTSGNGDATQGSDGRWYIDGGAYLSYVAAGYPNRATAEETASWIKMQTAARRAEKLARDRIQFERVGSGGSFSVLCKDGTCTVHQADEWASRGNAYTFPFVPADWMDDPVSMEAIAALPSFAHADIKEEEVTPSGLRVLPADDPPRRGDHVPYHPGMVLMPGQSTSIGVSVPIRPRASRPSADMHRTPREERP